MRNITIEYYSADDCPNSVPDELGAQLEALSEGLRLFSDASAGKKVSIRKLKRTLRIIRGKKK